MKILVIRFKEIGDALLTSVICNSLSKSFPHAKIDYLVYEISVPLLDGQIVETNVIGITKSEQKNPFKYLKKIKSISAKNYDIIIDTASTAKSGFISMFSHKCDYRIGRHRNKRFHFYTHITPPRQPRSNKVQERLAMLKPLVDDGMGIIFDEELNLQVSNKNVQDMGALMVQKGLDLIRPIFIFSVSSRLSYKQWRLDYQAEVAKHCIEKYNAQIVLYSGAPHETVDIKKFQGLVDDSNNVFSNVPTPTLKELSALIKNTNIFIGNECGPRHIAEALKVSSVAVFSPSSRKSEWMPSNSKKHLGIEWQSISNRTTSDLNFEFGDDVYRELYDSIRPAHVIRLVDDVIASHVIN